MNKKIAILQPEVPHFRNEFFQLLRQKFLGLSIHSYVTAERAERDGFNMTLDGLIYVPNISWHYIVLYSPWQLLKADVMVLMFTYIHITTWLLLFTKFIHRRKIILWGQGISVGRYLKEEKKPDWILRLMISLSDGVWLYTEKEVAMWKRLFPDKPIVSLNNSLTGVDEMLGYEPAVNAKALKDKYGVQEEVVFIFCARFENPYRRIDLLLETIKTLDSHKYGFIIIGEGQYKPDFSQYSNVHDFGALFDTSVKRELFSIADLYFQPGWVGLSIVEAMAYGKPVLTFRRSKHTLQCVEYSYIHEGENGLVFDTVDHLVSAVATLTPEAMSRMSVNAKSFVRDNIRPKIMVQRAASVINEVTQL